MTDVLCLDVRDLGKSFSGQLALTGFNLTVAPGEVHALVGENGSGKSTLIKILSGYHHPDPGGSVEVGGTPLVFGSSRISYALGCRFVHQDLGLIESSSILDNMSFNAGFLCRFGTIRDRELRRSVASDLARLELELDPRMPVAELAPAMKTGVAVARALRTDSQHPAKLLVLDEPTATLPSDQAQKLMSVVRAAAGAGVGVLYVTHHLGEVFDVAENVTVLRDGRKVTTQPARQLRRRDLITLLVGTELEEVQAASAARPADEGPATVRVEQLAHGSLQRLSLDLRPGDIVGLAGLTGSGRESALPAMFGATERESGQVVIDGRPLAAGRTDLSIRAGVAYLPASRADAGIMEYSGRENLTQNDLRPFQRLFTIDLRAEKREARAWFENMGVQPRGASEALLSTFSGGNQQKILLGKLLRSKPRVLLLDEPTQGVDVAAKAAIHRKILDAASAGTSVVVSSADVDELVALCQRVLVLHQGYVAADLSGDDLSVGAVSGAALGGGKVATP